MEFNIGQHNHGLTCTVALEHGIIRGINNCIELLSTIMLHENIDIELVSKITGYSIATIERIKSNGVNDGESYIPTCIEWYADGFERGLRIGKGCIAIRMLRKGLDIDLVSRVTCLPEEVLKPLRIENSNRIKWDNITLLFPEPAAKYSTASSDVNALYHLIWCDTERMRDIATLMLKEAVDVDTVVNLTGLSIETVEERKAIAYS